MCSVAKLGIPTKSTWLVLKRTKKKKYRTARMCKVSQSFKYHTATISTWSVLKVKEEETNIELFRCLRCGRVRYSSSTHRFQILVCPYVKRDTQATRTTTVPIVTIAHTPRRAQVTHNILSFSKPPASRGFPGEQDRVTLRGKLNCSICCPTFASLCGLSCSRTLFLLMDVYSQVCIYGKLCQRVREGYLFILLLIYSFCLYI